MSIRTNIIDQTVTDLRFISGNGYSSRLKNVEVGYNPVVVENDLDKGFVFLGAEKVVENSSDGVPAGCQADLIIVIQLSASEGEGKLTTAVETMIEDVKKWAQSGMKAATGITDNKWLTINTMSGVQWGSVSIKEISPYMDWKGTPQTAEIVFTLNVNYSPAS